MIKSNNFTSEELGKMVSKDSEFNIEQWYPLLEQHTFRTVFVPITLEEAVVLVRMNEAGSLWNKIELQEMENPHIYNIAEWLIGARIYSKNFENYIYPEEQKLLDQIVEKFDKAIQEVGGVAFARLSSRSPKDAALSSLKMRDCLKRIITSEENYDKIPQAQKQINDLLAFTVSCQQALQVSNGKEALDLFIHSKRVSQDIGMQRLHCGEENFSLNIVVREWANIPSIWEFRTLVYNNKITIITHYYTNCFVQEFIEREQEIVNRIVAKFEELNPIIPMDTYTIDFCVDPDSDKVWVVELNNPPPTAGVSFLDYEKEEDRQIIENGPFHFYYNHAPLEDPYAGVEPILVRYMKHLRGDLATIPDIGKHNCKCSACGMNPIVGERFCCIECGGCEYDIDSPTMVKSGTVHDESAFNMCCFCYSARVHEPTHHYIVFIDNDERCVSKLNQQIPRKNKPKQEKQPEHVQPAPPAVPTNTWCNLL